MNRDKLTGLLSRNALVVIWALLVIFFWRLLPDSFLSGDNIRATLTNYSVSALMALAVLVPLVCNQFDLSVGYVLGLVNILAVGLQVKSHVAWEVVILLMLALGALIGLVNGLIVTKAKMSSFITTLGTGIILYAIGLKYTSGEQIIGVLPSGFANLVTSTSGIPKPAIYVVVVVVVLWLALEYLPLGRRMYVVGSSERTAALVGIKTDRYVIFSFVVSGVLAAAAGVLLASLLQSGQSTTGPEYLLPAFAAVFLGSTAIRPGRVNAWGTIVAVLVLATVVTGLSLKGFESWVEPLFNGLMLISAVAVSGYLLRRKEAHAKADRAIGDGSTGAIVAERPSVEEGAR